MLIVIEWFVWVLSCAFAAWAFIVFIGEVFWPEAFPSGPKSVYPILLRRVITALYTLGITVAIVITAVYDVSKLHLLWFVPLFHFYGTQWIGWLYLSSQNRTNLKYNRNAGWEIDNNVDSLSHKENVEVEHLDQLKITRQGEILEHPFFEDYFEAIQSYSGKAIGKKGREKIKQLYCTVFPASILEMRWDGWQLGIPRPKDLMPEEAFDLSSGEATVFLRRFFSRVENDELYRDWMAVIDKFGDKRVASRMAGKTGLHYNIERVYWTFNIEFNSWIDQNVENYDCSLVCELDEIIARADSILREAFFPTPGPFDIGPKKSKEYQIKVLREVAPNLEKTLIEKIWD